MRLYGKESDVQVRRAAIEALSFHGNADVLVSLARKETNPELRRELVPPAVVMRLAGGHRIPHGDSEQVGSAFRRTMRRLSRPASGGPSAREAFHRLAECALAHPVKRTMNSCAGASPA